MTSAQMDGQPARTAFDVDQYERRVREGPCFVCALVTGHPDYRHHVVHEDDDSIAFLARNPTLLGHCLVAPKQHIESWVRDMRQDGFLRFQGIVYTVATALAATLPTERMYSLSLGSHQGNAHLHWHLAPLPPGVPYHQQQFHALMAENGVLDVDDEAQAALARDIRRHLRG
ncbi:HIT family protein [Micromonospora sp. NPDC049301]|uniref:HIT family protein n=1 Tax=Micromonospora sp. NPDC049301 TaxID=3155723 RepID=UPI0034142020